MSTAAREPASGGRVQQGVQIQIVVTRNAHEHELTDTELVRRAQRGVPAALTELVSRYQDRIYNTCYRMCHNDADALDLTQGTFLKAIEALPRFQHRSSFYTWLFRIAVNLTLTHRRTKARQRTHSLDEPVGNDCDGPIPAVPGRDAEVSRATEQRELQDRIEWALDHLDDEFRAAVVLKDIEGLDYAGIAEVLNVPIGTVKSRIHRGRTMLRDLLCDERKPVDAA